ncbi:MAG: M23 family metallopeptidase [Cyclobacteriaceae bacterium]|nr:M23 family metallopeptidase [Cyclobacteriaceae bacterium]
MARIKYYYDTESCRYERIKVSSWDIVFNSLGFLTVALILSIGIFFFYIKYFESPEEALLRKENAEMQLYYDLLAQDMDEAEQMLQSLSDRDDNIYRVIFGVDPVPAEIRNAGTGGANRYKEMMDEGLEREELIIKNHQRLDKLTKQMYIQTKSYDDIIELAKNKEALLASLPAIQPVSNKELKRLSSGYGYRIDPVFKTPRMHDGVDFSIEIGSPVYATGDGSVKLVHNSISGYGRQIEIDHGFGYVTKYAHLNKQLVTKGQRVKRGDLIGYSGNSGKSTAPHLHYEVHLNGKKVDPVHYFSKDLSEEEYEEILRLSSIENQAMGSY